MNHVLFQKTRENHPDLYNLYCNRSSEVKGTIVSGCDGKEYVAIFENNGGTVFEEKLQREQKRKQKLSWEVRKYVPKQFTVVDSVSILSNEQLDAAYRCILETLPLYKFHAGYLFLKGWSMNLSKTSYLFIPYN